MFRIMHRVHEFLNWACKLDRVSKAIGIRSVLEYDWAVAKFDKVDCYKYLGLSFSIHFSWSHNIGLIIM